MKKLLVVLGLTLMTVLALSGCEKEDAFVAGENDIIINAGTEWELEGVLTLPEGKGPFPLIVFTQAFNQPDTYFGESLAKGLEKQDIASIIFEQRIFTYPQITHDLNYTLKEGIVDDILSAAALAKTIKKIDPNLIFFAGFSFNGFLIPKIYEEDKKNTLTGFISLAGSARPLVKRQKSRLENALLNDPEMSEEEKDMYRSLISSYENVENLTEADRGKDQKLFGNYPSYWLYLAGYDPAESAKNMDKPVLFLHGDNDSNVLPEDLDLWKSTTQNNPKMVYKLYPGLGHDFGFSYMSKEVEEEVVVDIADFIKSQYN
ncbi:MAG: prolyl oligopeptidase family serine peptidase [Clostridiales bacterium]|nr:prolyl oligopeptidase family serine peptidase [Clostridiales bacterium]